MNLFERYGIKEVADVVFYSITKVGDEEFYTPVLVLDTLKVSTIVFNHYLLILGFSTLYDPLVKDLTQI